MKLIFDKHNNVKSWKQSIKLEDLEIIDIGGPAISLELLSLAQLIIVADYETERFRVMKDRRTGLRSVHPLADLGTFVADFCAWEQAGHTITQEAEQ